MTKWCRLLQQGLQSGCPKPVRWNGIVLWSGSVTRHWFDEEEEEWKGGWLAEWGLGCWMGWGVGGLGSLGCLITHPPLWVLWETRGDERCWLNSLSDITTAADSSSLGKASLFFRKTNTGTNKQQQQPYFVEKRKRKKKRRGSALIPGMRNVDD